jgi:mannosylglycerate hydrolase
VVRTVLELQAGEDVVRVTEEVDNAARDHRLRVLFPLPRPATGSRAECAFDVVERGLVAEGGLTEAPLATYPSRRFVCAGGLTVVHEGLNEYELLLAETDDDTDTDAEGGATPLADTLALTLLRCTGMLSQGPMATRPMPAGPLDPLEGPQLQGRHVLRYAVRLGEHAPHALADQVLLPLLLAPAADHRGGPAAPAEGQALEITGAEVAAVLRQGERLEVRVFNPTDAEVVVHVPGRSGQVVDLLGRPLEPFEDWFTLRAHGIATALLP